MWCKFGRARTTISTSEQKKWHKIHDRNKRTTFNHHVRWQLADVHKFKTQIQKSNHVLACLIPAKLPELAITAAATAAVATKHTHTWAFMFFIIIIIYDIAIWFSDLCHMCMLYWVCACVRLLHWLTKRHKKMGAKNVVNIKWKRNKQNNSLRD